MTNPTPNPSTATTLLARGYTVLPVTGHEKGPRLPGWSKMTQEQAAAALRTAVGATGWCLVPKPIDPVALVIVDVDTPNADLLDFWRKASPVDALPAGVAVARTVSGGLHIYFRAPSGHEQRRPAQSFDMGSYKGDLFASAVGTRGLMLPGSVADGKAGRGSYQWESAPLDLDKLPEMPLAAFQKLCKPPSQNNAPVMPTELHRLFDTFLVHAPDGCIAGGTFGTTAYNLGMICARIWARENPTQAFLAMALKEGERLCDSTAAEHEFDPQNFESQFRSGWGKGWQHHKGKRVILPSEAAAQAAMLFGAPVTMQTNVERGRTKGYVLTVGERSEEVASLSNREEVLGLLSQMGNCPEDTLGQSDIALDMTWWKAFQRHLHATTRYSKILGDDFDEFKDVLRQHVRDAADGGHIGQTVMGGAAIREDTKGVNRDKAWLKYTEGEAVLFLSVSLMERECQKFSGVTQKHLVDIGKKKRGAFHYWEIPLTALDSDDTLRKLVGERDLERRRRQVKPQKESTK
jgi:hypothetical protein